MLTDEQIRERMRIVHALDRDWLWPVEDTHMPANEFAQLYREAEAIFLPALKQRRACIQAGGHVGVWPHLMTEVFGLVYTFEPDPRSFHCLAHNCAADVFVRRAALGRDPGMVGTRLAAHDNRGSVQVVKGKDVPCITIDSLDIDVDLIYLDIEGFERLALEGARETIARCRPVIGIEVKFGPEALDLLRSWGYRVIGRTRNDVILQC